MEDVFGEVKKNSNAPQECDVNNLSNGTFREGKTLDEEQSLHEKDRFTCGLLTWRAKFLQKFARPKWFLVFQCWLVLSQGMIVSGLTGVVISSLEKRFFLKTSQVGAITSCYDVAAALMAIVVSYYGHHHKPKWLGSGAVILSIGCFLFALPHLLVGNYIPRSNGDDLCLANATMSSTSSNIDICQSSVWYIILTFVIAEVFIGVGATPVYVLGPAFVDENVKHTTSGLYLGIMYAVATIGPAVGYLLGGKLLEIFVDLKQPPGVNLKSTDFNFIGAWWLGYIFGGTLALLCSVPLIMFPRELPGTAAIRAEKKRLSDTVRDPNIPHTVKELLPSLKGLLTNPTFVFLALAAAFEGLAVTGFSTYWPKFVEAQFRLSSSKASLYTGLVTVPGGSIGMFAGGYLIKRMKWNCAQILKACSVIATIAFLCVSTILFGCPNREFAGITTPYFNSSSQGSIETECNTNCGCIITYYKPLCSINDQVTYYSPCLAGCTIENKGAGNVYNNCSCFADQTSQAIQGSGCEPECDSFIPFMVGLFVLMVMTFLNNIPAMTATLRCIPESKGSFGLGVNQLIVRILAFIPGPIIFGAVIDSTCRLSQKDSCDEGAERNCLEYDTDKFRYVMFGMGSLFKLFSAISFVLAWKVYKLPNTGTEPNHEGHDHNVLENSMATEMEMAMNDPEENAKLAPLNQIINVNSLDGVVKCPEKDKYSEDNEVTIL